MPKGFYKEVCAEIKANGYVYLTNAKGSHEKWKHAETNTVVLVPKNLKSRHTANAVMKSAGLTKKF